MKYFICDKCEELKPTYERVDTLNAGSVCLDCYDKHMELMQNESEGVYTNDTL